MRCSQQIITTVRHRYPESELYRTVRYPMCKTITVSTAGLNHRINRLFQHPRIIFPLSVEPVREAAIMNTEEL